MILIMAWQIIYFETNSGRKPVYEVVARLQPAAKAKYLEAIELLSVLGPHLVLPWSRKLNREIYELRIRGREELRVLYCFLDHKIYLLHAFRKQKQKLPQQELAIAHQRLKRLDHQ